MKEGRVMAMTVTCSVRIHMMNRLGHQLFNCFCLDSEKTKLETKKNKKYINGHGCMT